MKYSYDFFSRVVKGIHNENDVFKVEECIRTCSEDFTLEEYSDLQRRVALIKQVFSIIKSDFPKPYYEPLFVLKKIQYAKTLETIIAINLYLERNGDKYTASNMTTLQQSIRFKKAELNHKLFADYDGE